MPSSDLLPADRTGPDRGEAATLSATSRPEGKMGEQAALGDYEEELGQENLLAVMQRFQTENVSAIRILNGIWRRSYQAYHAQHWEGSKYRKKEYESRSKLFRPKTRSAVRKNAAQAAAALLNTSDVVVVKAEHDDDPQQKSSAAVKHELLNYRLDRGSARGGIPWFQTVVGSHMTAQIQGWVVSLQDWEYRTVKKKKKRTVQKEVMDPEGLPVLDPDPVAPLDPSRAMPRIEEVEEQYVERIIVADRPTCQLIPPDHCWVDLRGSWIDPAQESSMLVLRFPMSIGALKAKMKEEERQRFKWLEVDGDMLISASSDYDPQGMTIAAEANSAVSSQGQRAAQTAAADDFKTVWVHLNFATFGGEDYCWWSLGARYFLSEVQCTRDVYPQYFGRRPVVIGMAAIEPHVLHPRSPVESWRPLQEEANDVANLYLDAMRQSIEPTAKYRNGSIVDTKALRMRGSAGANVPVTKMEDLEFDRMPEPSGQAQMSLNYLDLQFDDLAGVFNGATVQGTRTLNETVGGMRLLSGAANLVTEFDLRVWTETWAERVLRQIMQSQQYYETDEIVLAIAGKKAGALERPGDPVTDEMLAAEVSVTVNVGLGANNPMERLQKLQMALMTVKEALPFADKPVKVIIEEVIGEAFGAVGFKDGMRFFEIGDPAEVPPDPETIKLQMEAALKTADIEARERIGDKSNASRERIALLNEITGIIQEIIQQQGEANRATQQVAANRSTAAMGSVTKLISENERNRTTRWATEKKASAPKPAPKKSGG